MNPAPVDHLRRYEPLVDDLGGLLEACQRPLPRVVWSNPLLAGDIDVGAIVRARQPDAVAIEGIGDGRRHGAWRLPARVRPGRWPEYALGWLHGQEEAALWAVPLLDPRPGERVLDLCAAPGGKTAQLAVAMEDRGLLVANDKRWDRLVSLRHNLARLGVTSAVVTNHDGVGFPALPASEGNGDDDGLFDRVLADVPCTCEGTARKHRGQRGRDAERFRFSAAQTQVALLRRAAALTRPGGTFVYATCTFAPEENEAVLSALDPELATVEPVGAIPGLVTRPGVTRWGDRSYRGDVANAVRIWPHLNDTGGFFLARLRRLA